MIYKGKEYRKREVLILSDRQDTCKGCAFATDQSACEDAYDQYDQETYCQVWGRSFIFEEIENKA